MLFACSVFKKTYQNNRMLLEMIYKNQKEYYDSEIVNKADFSPLIGFASKGRKDIYANCHFSFVGSGKYILLKGVVNSSGRYAGIVFSDSATLLYTHSTVNRWQFLRFSNSSEDSLMQATGIGKNIIHRVKNMATMQVIHILANILIPEVLYILGIMATFIEKINKNEKFIPYTTCFFCCRLFPRYDAS
jgi:hypothetical protein